MSPIDTATTYGEILAESFEGLGEDLRAQVSEDFGVLPAESVGFGDTRTVTVPAGGSAGLGIEFARDEFVETLGGFELSMAAVTFEADDRVELQHGLLDFVDDDAENRIRLRADSPELLVVSSEPEAPRSRGVVFHNRGDEPVTVTVTVREVPYLALDPDGTASGVIDEFGTPWLVDAGFDFGILTGADGFELTFERLPWLEPRAGRPFSNEFRDLVFVVGDPGDRFEVDPG